MISVLETAVAAEVPASYVTEFESELPEAVYKSVDGRGRVTYSRNRPEDTVMIEEITIEPGPPAEYIEDSRQRYGKLRKAAAELAEYREKRLAEREEEEKKRLERLALQRSARPQVYERRVYVGWNPLWWSYPHKVHHRVPYKRASHPQHGSAPLRSTPLQPGKPLR